MCAVFGGQETHNSNALWPSLLLELHPGVGTCPASMSTVPRESVAISRCPASELQVSTQTKADFLTWVLCVT